MINVYDIVLNFSESRIYEFFEWDKKDDIEHIKKIPLFRVDTKTLNDIINKKLEVEKFFLEKIENKTEIFSKKKEELIEYACLFCDMSKVVAVEFNCEGQNIYKSYLLLDEEEELLEITASLDHCKLNYTIKKNTSTSRFLTRKEEFIKNYLIRDLKSSYTNKNYHKINYMYEECFKFNNKTIDDKYNELVSDINSNFTNKYTNLFQILKMSTKKKVK